MTAEAAALRAAPSAGEVLEARYAADHWRAAELGVPATRGRDTVSFTGVEQPWLRGAAKRWARQRLAVGCAFNTVRAGVAALKRFSGFLAGCCPPTTLPAQIDRALLLRYLAWLAPQPSADSTKALSRVFLRAFLEENRRYSWVRAIPLGAVIYPDELSSHHRSLPRFIPEFVMAQLESAENLALLRPHHRHLIVLITETGLRATDACTLAFDPLQTDSAGWPCLRFVSSKMRAEHLLPLSAKAAQAIRDQQDDVRRLHADGTAWLFPSRSDPAQPTPYDTLRVAFTSWQQRIRLHDETGSAARVTIHQLRHSLGTRLINAGVPQHVGRRLRAGAGGHGPRADRARPGPPGSAESGIHRVGLERVEGGMTVAVGQESTGGRGLGGGQVSGTRHQAGVLATLGFFGGFAGVSVFGPMVPKFAGLLDLSPFAAGMLAAMPSLTGSLLRIPFAAAVERVGGKRPFLALLVISNVGMAGLLVLLATSYPDSMAGTYPLLLLLGALIGCGIATFSVGIAQVSFWFPKKEQGGPLGAYAGLGNTSPGLSSLLLPLAVGGIGILGAYGVWFAILLVVTLVYGLFIKDAPWFQLSRRGHALTADQLAAADLGGGDLVPAGQAMVGLKGAARVPVTWILVFFYFLSFGGFLAFTSWLPTYWTSMYDTSLRQAGILTAIFSLISALIRVPGGLLSDKISIRYALPGNFLLMLAGSLVLSFSGNFGLSLLATVVVAAGMGLQNAVVFKLLPRYVPDAVGGASGWVGGLGALGGFVIPPVMGVVTGLVGGTSGYARGFLPFAVLVLLALPVVGVLDRWSTRHGYAAT